LEKYGGEWAWARKCNFDPGDLGHVNVLDPQKGAYIVIPALNQAYAKGLSFWQNKVIRRYAQRRLNERTDIVALAQANAEIRALVERDFNRKSTRGRKRHARYMEDHTAGNQPVVDVTLDPQEMKPPCLEEPPAEAAPAPKPPPVRPAAYADDEILPVFEADLDLPHLSAAVISTAAIEKIQ